MSGLDLSWLARGEIILVVAVLSLLAGAPRLERAPWAIVAIGLLASAAVFICGLRGPAAQAVPVLVVAVVVAIAFLLLQSADIDDLHQRPEVAALLLIGAVGGIVLASAANLLELALGVELISLSAAALVALGRGARALEAGYKYFLLTAMTFATLLFGMGLVFVGTGAVDFPNVAALKPEVSTLVLAGCAFMVVGVAFKLAVVPLHFGALDAYTAGPAPLVGFVMVISKLGAAYALARLAAAAGAGVDTMLMLVGLVTITFGVLASFAQRDLRRLLAYSAVAHAGFLALAAASGALGKQAAAFYVVNYGAAALLCFGALADRGAEGLALRKLGTPEGLGPVRSAALLVGLLSLAGVPPFPGFWAKLAVLQASWQTWRIGPTAVAAIGGVLGIVYYLRPMPDLLAQLRGTEVRRNPRELLVLGALFVLVVGLSVGPGLAWTFVGAR